MISSPRFTAVQYTSAFMRLANDDGLHQVILHADADSVWQNCSQVYYIAKKCSKRCTAEEYAIALARHFVDTYPKVEAEYRHKRITRLLEGLADILVNSFCSHSQGTSQQVINVICPLRVRETSGLKTGIIFWNAVCRSAKQRCGWSRRRGRGCPCMGSNTVMVGPMPLCSVMPLP